jgi:spermidine synthase
MAYTEDNGGMPTSIPPTTSPMHPPADAHLRPFVREELDAQSMHFSDSAIQSRMQLRQPDALILEYTRTMMGFLMFEPAPRRIAMIGLGGGSIAKFCHRHLPDTALTVVEINPHVIALRERFQVPPDGPRFRVVQDDGAHFVATTHDRFDVLLIDAFDADGLPESLATRRFYDDCSDVLGPAGLLVANLHASHPHVPVYLDRLGAALGGPLLRVDDRDATNSVVFARRHGQPLRPAVRGAPPLAELRDAFSRIVQALQKQDLR